MLDANQFSADVLFLVDSNPRNDVDISDLIRKYTIGQERIVQQQIRRLICTELVNLKKAGEIDFNDSEMSQLNTLNSYSFIRDSLNIKSTYEREKKSKSEVLVTRINELTLEALQRDNDNAALKKQLDEALLKLSAAQHADIPKNAQHRSDTLIWQIIA